MSNKRKIGLIVNPFSGIGGRVGLKGSDGAEIRNKAIALGAKQESMIRAAEALRALQPIKDNVDILTCSAAMGEDSCIAAGLEPIVIKTINTEQSTAQDTIDSVQALIIQGVELLLFAGGDGTARDIYSALKGIGIPVIGIPAGVKIHSAVYAKNPKSAGNAAYNFLVAQSCTFVEAEVMDIDEELFREEVVKAKLYGYLVIPEFKQFMQNVKTGGYSKQDALVGIASGIINSMEDGVLYIIGPGTTTKPIMDFLGLKNTLLGVDVIMNKKLIANDVSESQLFDLIYGKKAKAVITIIGGQGHILGRGNQQISPRIIKYIGKNNFIVVASHEKLVSLQHAPLIVDTGDSDLNKEFCGYIDVITGYDVKTVYKVTD